VHEHQHRVRRFGLRLEKVALQDDQLGDTAVDVADTGDGFNATFAVAAQVNGMYGAPDPAHLLVLGGDEVYPVASVENYEDRLVSPFDAARPADSYGQASMIEGAFVVAMEVDGERLTSVELSQRLERWGARGKGLVAFLIGGAEGIPNALSARADLRLSLSSFTFPHRLARVMLLEQLYRSMTLQRGEPYAREE